MLNIITTLISLIIIQPPLILLRLFWTIVLLPLRITLLPPRIFLSVVSNVVSILWTVYGRILQLLYNFPALIPWTLLVSLIASLTGYCLHHLSRFLYNTQYLSSSSATTPDSPPSFYPPRAQNLSSKHLPKQQPISHSNPYPSSPTLHIPPPISPSLNIPLPRSPSPNTSLPVPTSPLAALLPPDSPLLSRYTSPTPHNIRPTPDRNISYRSQMRELMTERQEQLIALHEEEKRRRTLSPRLSDAGSPTFPTPSQIRMAKDAASSPVLMRQRPESGNGRDRPVSWPPLVLVEVGGEETKGMRSSSGGYTRNSRGGSGGGDGYKSTGLALDSSAFPSVPNTILEEVEEEEEDSSDSDFY